VKEKAVEDSVLPLVLRHPPVVSIQPLNVGGDVAQGNCGDIRLQLEQIFQASLSTVNIKRAVDDRIGGISDLWEQVRAGASKVDKYIDDLLQQQEGEDAHGR